MATYTSKINTGRISFDDQKIIGALGGSGDEAGNDTIELVPDIDLYDTYQYLVVDPTGPNHIHIRAGGVQDASTADLFFGGERTGVQVSDATGDVNIRSKNPDQLNTYANDNGTSNAQFIHATSADIIVGDTVRLWAGGDLFTVTAVTLDSPAEGSMTVVADGLTFTTGESYNFYRSQGENIWQFKNDGSTRFPIMDPDLHNDNSPPELGEVLQFNSIYQSVITNAVPALDVDAQRIIIQGQRGTGTGEGGDVYLWGGDSTVDGGDIKIYAGDADSSVGGVAPDLHDGGYVYIRGGTGFDTGGEVRLTGGYSSGGIGGNIQLSAGYGTSAAGEVIIESNSNTWTFNNDGNITIPNGKDILDVAGNSATGGGNRYKSVDSAASPTITYETENIILVTTTGISAQNTTIRLPDRTSVPVGYDFTVMDFTGAAANKTITILPKSGDEIISIGGGDGIVINTNYGLVSFKNIFAGWAILYGR